MEKSELKEILMSIIDAYINLDEKVSDKQIVREILIELEKIYDL